MHWYKHSALGSKLLEQAGSIILDLIEWKVAEIWKW